MKEALLDIENKRKLANRTIFYIIFEKINQKICILRSYFTNIENKNMETINII